MGVSVFLHVLKLFLTRLRDLFYEYLVDFMGHEYLSTHLKPPHFSISSATRPDSNLHGLHNLVHFHLLLVLLEFLLGGDAPADVLSEYFQRWLERGQHGVLGLGVGAGGGRLPQFIDDCCKCGHLCELELLVLVRVKGHADVAGLGVHAEG